MVIHFFFFLVVVTGLAVLYDNGNELCNIFLAALSAVAWSLSTVEGELW
jgi:hypothetical protein